MCAHVMYLCVLCVRCVQTPSTGLRHPSFSKVPESDARSVRCVHARNVCACVSHVTYIMCVL